jgi:hypothetical protein
MTTITAPRTGPTRRRDIRTAAVAGLVGMAVGGILVAVVPRLTTGGTQATGITPALVQQHAANPGLHGSWLQEQVPQAAAAWLAARASSYEVGGSTYDQQVPYAARHDPAAPWAQQSSAYREQVPAFE